MSHVNIRSKSGLLGAATLLGAADPHRPKRQRRFSGPWARKSALLASAAIAVSVTALAALESGSARAFPLAPRRVRATAGI